MKYKTRQQGFTLIELTVCVAIIGLLSSVIIAKTSSIRARARDGERIAAIGSYVLALEQYKEINGAYPTPASSGTGSLFFWKVSYLPHFMDSLQPYLSSHSEDPLDIGPPTNLYAARPDGNYFFMYNKYDGALASALYGCNTSRDFAIFGFRAVETEAFDKTNFPKARCGPMPCVGSLLLPGIVLGVCRDWSAEMDYSVMLVE